MATELCPGIIFPGPYPQGYGDTPLLPRPCRPNRAFQGACPRPPRMAMPLGVYSRPDGPAPPGGQTGPPTGPRCRIRGRGRRSADGRAPGATVTGMVRSSLAPRSPPAASRELPCPHARPPRPPALRTPRPSRRATWSAGPPSAALSSPSSSSSTERPSAGPPRPPSASPPSPRPAGSSCGTPSGARHGPAPRARRRPLRGAAGRLRGRTGALVTAEVVRPKTDPFARSHPYDFSQLHASGPSLGKWPANPLATRQERTIRGACTLRGRAMRVRRTSLDGRRVERFVIECFAPSCHVDIAGHGELVTSAPRDTVDSIMSIEGSGLVQNRGETCRSERPEKNGETRTPRGA